VPTTSGVAPLATLAGSRLAERRQFLRLLGMWDAHLVTALGILLELGADPTVPNEGSGGGSALDYAVLAVGATRWQTIRYIVLPQIMPAIVAGIVLGASRALGETLAVLMVVGNVPQAPSSIFDAGYPLPALIANNYGEMMSIPLYDAALLGAALVLLVVILIFNILSTLVLQRFLRRS